MASLQVYRARSTPARCNLTLESAPTCAKLASETRIPNLGWKEKKTLWGWGVCHKGMGRWQLAVLGESPSSLLIGCLPEEAGKGQPSSCSLAHHWRRRPPVACNREWVGQLAQGLGDTQVCLVVLYAHLVLVYNSKYEHRCLHIKEKVYPMMCILG